MGEFVVGLEHKLYKSRFTHTTTQYFYAEVNPRLERVLGSTNMHASSKVFVNGDYRFPVEQNSTPGYIEVRNVSFNATNRPTQGGSVANGTGASGGSGGKRRNVVLKSSPAKPRYTLGVSSQAGSSRSTPLAKLQHQLLIVRHLLEVLISLLAVPLPMTQAG